MYNTHSMDLGMNIHWIAECPIWPVVNCVPARWTVLRYNVDNPCNMVHWNDLMEIIKIITKNLPWTTMHPCLSFVLYCLIQGEWKFPSVLLGAYHIASSAHWNSWTASLPNQYILSKKIQLFKNKLNYLDTNCFILVYLDNPEISIILTALFITINPLLRMD